MWLWLEVPSWPPLPRNQGVHWPEERPLWLRQRRPFMELSVKNPEAVEQGGGAAGLK
jgi:hypothetical protein